MFKIQIQYVDLGLDKKVTFGAWSKKSTSRVSRPNPPFGP